jgi:hypothetical protein
MQPLNFIGSQFMAYLEPFLTFVIPRDAYNDIQKILEQRKGIDYFLSILEDEEFEKQERKIFKKEMIRISEISENAVNHLEIIDAVYERLL